MIQNFLNAETIKALNEINKANGGNQAGLQRWCVNRPVRPVGGESIEHWGEVAAAEYEVVSHNTDLDDMEVWGHPTTVADATRVVNGMLLNDPVCTFEDEAIFAECYLGVLLLDDGMYPEDEVGFCAGNVFFRFKTKEPHFAIFADLTPQQRVQVYNNVFFRDAACKAV